MVKRSSNRSFGILFFVVFLLVSFWPILYEQTPRMWPIPISIIFLILGLLNSKLLTPLNSIWIKFELNRIFEYRHKIIKSYFSNASYTR